MDDQFHPGECEVQRRAGVRAEAQRVGEIIGNMLSPGLNAFLMAQSFVIAAGERDGKVWITWLEGAPGFVRAERPDVVNVAPRWDHSDPLLGGRDAPSQLGLLAIDFVARKRLRVNGRATRDGNNLRVEIDQAYTNCPKYIRQHTLATVDSPRAEVERGDGLTPALIERISAADTFFIGTCHPTGCDASHRGGEPGFLTLRDDCLEWEDYAGNNMFQSFGNLALDSRCGLLLPDFERGDLLHLTGDATIDWSPPDEQGRAARRVSFRCAQWLLRRGAASTRIPQRA